MTAPEQDHPDRLAEIKQHPIDPDAPCLRAFTGRCTGDRDWLIAEVERLRAEHERTVATARRLLDNLQWFAEVDSDPGTEALCAIYEARQLLLCPSAPPNELIREAAEAIAEVIGHEQEDDTPEGPCCDNTLGCGGHQVEPGCGACASFGWPCDVALDAARAGFKAISSSPDALALPAKDGAR